MIMMTLMMIMMMTIMMRMMGTKRENGSMTVYELLFCPLE